MSNQADMIALIKSISGQANVLTIPRVYIAFTKSHRAALFLSQCVYWSDRSHHADGWFDKSYRDWRHELGLQQHAVETCIKALTSGGWLETKIDRVGIRNTTFYRANLEKIAESVRVTLADSANVETAKVHKRKTIRSSIEQRSPTIDRSSPATPQPEGGQPATPDKKTRKPTDREIARATLEDCFSTVSGIAKPGRDTVQQKKAAGMRWWQPLDRIWEAADKDTEVSIRHIEMAYRQMLADRLTVSAPQSIEQVAVANIAKEKKGIPLNGHSTANAISGGSGRTVITAERPISDSDRARAERIRAREAAQGDEPVQTNP